MGYYGAENTDDDTQLMRALQQIKYWNSAAVVTQFMPEGLFHLEKEDSGKKTCAFLYGGDTLKRAENASFSEARDMCAMEILKCEDYRAAYVDWVEKAYKVEQAYVAEYTENAAASNQTDESTTNKSPTNSNKNAWDKVAPVKKICRPIKGNIESYFNEAENVWTEMSLKRKYGDALLENPALELNQLKQVNKWTDLNIEITLQTGEKFMRAELTVVGGEKVVGLASSKKAAKAAACQVVCMLVGFY